jgi:hypothetical protein
MSAPAVQPPVVIGWWTTPLISGLSAVAKEGIRWALQAAGRGVRAVLARVQ